MIVRYFIYNLLKIYFLELLRSAGFDSKYTYSAQLNINHNIYIYIERERLKS